MRLSGLVLSLIVLGCASQASEELLRTRPMTTSSTARGELRLEIHSPPADQLLARWETEIRVEGGASVFGGVKFLDLMLALDTSQSLRGTDPENHRTLGAIALVKALPQKSDVRIGVVDFDDKAALVAPLTEDRNAVVQALKGLDRVGRTNLAGGIETALAELERDARPDASRVILLFTDGKSNADKARRAAAEARRRGVAVHALLLGTDRKGAEILHDVSSATGASFIHVTDPAELPKAFLDLRTTGIETVALQVNESDPIPSRLRGATFSGMLPLRLGDNRITAIARSLDGRTEKRSVTVTVTGPMRVSIETPSEGDLFSGGETEIAVEGTVDAFVDLPAERTSGRAGLDVREVVLRVNDSPPLPAALDGRRFVGRIRLEEGENRISAVARSSDGRSAGDAMVVRFRSPGCAELRVSAAKDGREALSISQRSIEVVVDASNSMWGQIEGRAKMTIAQDTLREVLGSLPDDLGVALRVYGHRHAREARRCDDSELLIPFGPGGHSRIGEAINELRPRGQTPLAYSLDRIAEDFGNLEGERAVVLVTDGIESCGGDPAASAGALQQKGSLPVHVIGFGLTDADTADVDSLRSIAEASGGRFFAAGNARELRDALAVTVGTPFRVMSGDVVVAEGALGGGEQMFLPAGPYRVRIDSSPPHEVPVTLVSEEALSVVVEREGGTVSDRQSRRSTDYEPCSSGAVVPAAPEAFPAAHPRQ